MTVWGILAGGRGTRFGEPKVSAKFVEDTFLELILQRVSACARAGDNVVVSVALGDPEGVASFVANRSGETPVEIITDTAQDPGPAHAVGNLAAHAARAGVCLVTVAVDQIRVLPRDFEALRDATESHPDSVSVAFGPNGRHWVFAAVPSGMVAKIARDAESVNSLQGLYILNAINDVAVDPDSLVDVNTRDLLP